MRFDTSQSMRMGQQMKLAPRMIQSMEILQMALPQLEERIEQELESNIALELGDASDGGSGEAPNGALGEEAGTSDSSELSVDESNASDDFERLSNLEENYAEAFDNEYSSASASASGESTPASTERFDFSELGTRAAASTGERDAKMDAMANTAARSGSLTDQLVEQWSFIDVREELREPGKLVIEHIEDDGYLRTDLETILDHAPDELKQDLTVEDLERALTAIQLFLEPAGVGARDTRECLLLQIDKLLEEGVTPMLIAAREVISDHLDDLASNRIPKIVQKTGLSVDEVKHAVEAMKGLRLHPGKELSNATEPALVPDAVVEYDEDADDYRVYLTDARLPTLRVNQEYAVMAKDKDLPKRDRDFIKTNLGNAQWLIEAVEQRKSTLLRVVKAVAAAQRAVFDEGPEAIKPLPMTQVADQLGIHVATVSRAVAGKHLLTPRGVMPLRMFFTGGTTTAEGEDVSWERIKAAMREVIDGEDKNKPLSDEAISKALKAKGFDIARRTVAKYRDQLDIPMARMRKQFA
ncbi:MAG: RNA polymerase factor sigma-54 [Planctomycetota bacterium]